MHHFFIVDLIGCQKNQDTFRKEREQFYLYKRIVWYIFI